MEKNIKNEGIGLIDFFNIHKIRKELISEEIIEKDKIKFKIKRKIHSNQVIKNINFNFNSIDYNFTEKVNTLKLSDFEKYFNKTNLIITEVFGDYQLNKFKPENSPRLIILFKKKIPAK